MLNKILIMLMVIISTTAAIKIKLDKSTIIRQQKDITELLQKNVALNNTMAEIQKKGEELNAKIAASNQTLADIRKDYAGLYKKRGVESGLRGNSTPQNGRHNKQKDNAVLWAQALAPELAQRWHD